MPNLAQLLKDEIIRLARRELKKETAALQKASSRHRKDIAELKRQQAKFESQLKASTRIQAKNTALPVTDVDADLRFRADGFRTLRKRLGVSAEQMGQLLGVSGQSVYAWEQKRTTPRRSQLPAIAALRGMGKREAMQRLETPKT